MPNSQLLASASLHLLTHPSTSRTIVLNWYVYVIVNMDASADKSDWRAPRLADLRRQRSKPCWLYRHEFYLWIVNVDRETGCGSASTTEPTVATKELEEMDVIDAVQDQLKDLRFPGSASQDGSDEDLDAVQDQSNDLKFPGSASQDNSDEDLEPDLEADVSGSYDTNDSSLSDSSSWETSDASNSEIHYNPHKTDPATGKFVIKIWSFMDLIDIRLPLVDPTRSLPHGWRSNPKLRVHEDFFRSLDAISLNYGLVPREIKDDPGLQWRLADDRAIENINVSAPSSSLLGYDRSRLEFAHLTHVRLASERLHHAWARDAWAGIVHLSFVQLLRIQFPELLVEYVPYTNPGVQHTSTYTPVKLPFNLFEFSWKSDYDYITTDESTIFDASIITFRLPENPHGPLRVVVTETRRSRGKYIVEAQLVLSAMAQFRNYHRTQKGDAYFCFPIPLLMAIKNDWTLYFAIDGTKIEICEYGMLGRCAWWNCMPQILASLKAVVQFVNEKVLPGYRAEVLLKD